MDKFERIVRDIKEIKIQGATNVAKAGLKALSYRSNSLNELKKAIHILKKTRPTEPMLHNSLNYVLEKVRGKSDIKSFVKKESKKFIKSFAQNKKKIIDYTSNLINKDSVIFTHCHSSTVTSAIISSKNKVKYVINTETRPLFQGRKTAKELSSAGIKVIHIVDSAMADYVKDADFVFVGADAITKDFFVNKVGTLGLSILSKKFKIPFYVLADLLKFTEKVKIEFRSEKEIWKNPPKNVKILNPAFDKIPLKYVKGIITQEGILKPNKLLKVIKSKYGYLYKY